MPETSTTTWEYATITINKANVEAVSCANPAEAQTVLDAGKGLNLAKPEKTAEPFFT
jgi:hypothetical protein